jgi:hypothetical protein
MQHPQLALQLNFCVNDLVKQVLELRVRSFLLHQKVVLLVHFVEFEIDAAEGFTKVSPFVLCLVDLILAPDLGELVVCVLLQRLECLLRVAELALESADAGLVDTLCLLGGEGRSVDGDSNGCH